jgi:arsenate reductase (thioredoxin)
VVKSILFLGLELSCSAQMAEAIARRLAPPGTRIFSAAVTPQEIPRGAREAMKEIGVEMPQKFAPAIECVPIDCIDLVVALGETGAPCPVLPAGTRFIHWPIPDAYRIAESEAPLRAVFRFIRDELEKNVAALFLDHWRNGAR